MKGSIAETFHKAPEVSPGTMALLEAARAALDAQPVGDRVVVREVPDITVTPYAEAMDARWKDCRNRVGRFRVSREMVDKHPGAVASALARTLVVRAECHYSFDGFDGFEYIALSPDFDFVGVGAIAPDYDLLFLVHHGLPPAETGLGAMDRVEFLRFERMP